MKEAIPQSNSVMTLQDIALRAGVSKATVSFVLNDSPKVGAKTRTKVQAIIQSLHYHPNEEARKLAQKRWAVPTPGIP